MGTLNKTEWEILNATADDWESLETIYRTLNRPPEASEAHAIGPVGYPCPLLEVVADGIRHLVEGGYLEARLLDSPHQELANLRDLSYVWRGWFQMTPSGREVWEREAPAHLPQNG
jgi:hypothetical protein